MKSELQKVSRKSSVVKLHTRSGQHHLRSAAKSDTKEPAVTPVSLPQGIAVSPRRPGRPKGAKNKPKEVTVAKLAKKSLDEKIVTTYQGMLNDAETLAARALTVGITSPGFDGGGTSETAHVITKESLERRVARRLNVLDRYLTDERLLALLNVSTLKEIGVYEGIMLDKSLVLKGQPTVIVGSNERAQLNDMLPKLLTEMRRRGMVTVAKERSIEFKPGVLSESTT